MHFLPRHKSQKTEHTITMKFEDLDWRPYEKGSGIRATVDFSNGFGASIIQTCYSHGGGIGAYELAVTRNGAITYKTSVTSDVRGYLKPLEVENLIREIRELNVPVPAIPLNVESNPMSPLEAHQLCVDRYRGRTDYFCLQHYATGLAFIHRLRGLITGHITDYSLSIIDMLEKEKLIGENNADQ